MKRSEMIDIISEFLDNHVTQDTGYAWKYSKESSDTLLNMMEEAGMASPEYDKVIHSEFVKGGVTTFPTREWEQEDET